MKDDMEKIACHVCKKMIPKAAALHSEGKNMSSIFVIQNVWIIGKRRKKRKKRINKLILKMCSR